MGNFWFQLILWTASIFSQFQYLFFSMPWNPGVHVMPSVFLLLSKLFISLHRCKPNLVAFSFIHFYMHMSVRKQKVHLFYPFHNTFFGKQKHEQYLICTMHFAVFVSFIYVSFGKKKMRFPSAFEQMDPRVVKYSKQSLKIET